MALTPYVARQSPSRHRKMRWACGSDANGWECVAEYVGTVGFVVCALGAFVLVPVWDVVVNNGGAMTPVEVVAYWTERGAYGWLCAIGICVHRRSWSDIL